MGNTQSTPSVPKDVKYESYKSARNVLENIGIEIYNEEKKKVNAYTSQLRGDLSRARFHDGLHKAADLGVRPGPGDSCSINHLFHTNINNGTNHGRNPCDLRNQNRFGENAEAYCNSDKIRVTGKKSDGTACAPFRRQNLCDKNLEYLINENTNTTDDLLGNVLVTAKYEGESIVKNHPHKGTSDVCTALARSFADIGDIVRGKDMFKRTDKDDVENGLREVFGKIHKKLGTEGKEYYNDTNNKINYVKLREDWWTANRDQVWRAITCYIPYYVNYFKKKSDDTIVFTNDGKCGHYEGAPPTNLDYVPQFLRWFDEWAEEFCRKKKDKLNKVKEACRDEEKKKYCSLNGYDCTQTIWKKGVLHWSNKCTDCSVKCNLYEIWLGNQREAFRKQKEKYAKEKETYQSNSVISNRNINKEYYKEFYKEFYGKLKNEYKDVDNFLTLLNEGRYCKTENVEEEVIKFTNSGDKETFYRSQYCQVCPDCGVDCKSGSCIANPNNDDNCSNKESYTPPKGAPTTEITVLYSGEEEGNISNKLSEFCRDEKKINSKNIETWKCYYESTYNNACKMEKKNANNMSEKKITKFHNFFELWVIYLLTETIRWNDKIKNCINNTTIHCIDECNKNCVCFDKWVKQKGKEWNSIKKLFIKEQKMPNEYYLNIKNHFEGYFFHVMKKLNKEAKWNELMENLRTKINSSKKNKGTKDSEGAIKVLFDHLKETATICKDNNTNEACASSKKSKTNPCAKNTKAGSDKVISVKQIAQYYKRKAHAQLEEGGGSRSALKGDASQGQYERTGNASDFKTKLCTIKDTHSNRDPKRSDGPCYGKNPERFNIGTEWSYGENKKEKTHPKVYMPQRREHMCTSNLENLNTNSKGLSDGTLASHSLLGDILLAAKYEANFIKKKYNHDNNPKGFMDKATICRAIKYSFADLGDIIRGKDMWEHSDQTQLQRHLKTIFGKIKDTLKNKYTKEVSPYTQLRSDWWEANRHQVWRAMKCHISNLNVKSYNGKSSSHCGYSDHTPLDDYVPQRLRWMTEWAEWYCKEQSRLYGDLEKMCAGCKGKQKCTQGNGDCAKCKTACDAYRKNIKTWQNQWTKIKQKYYELYQKATESGDTKSDKDQHVVEFLRKLHEQNKTSDNKTYDTAAGYVHQEAKYLDCKTQTQFCEKKNGVKPPNGAEDDNYTFKDPPNGYDVACKCDENKQKPPETPKEDACKIVKELLKDKKATDDIDGCNQKYKAGKDKYPVWDCEKNIDPKHNGACMPPRRQKLCIYNLEHHINGTSTDQDLKKAFILCAAKETFLLWQKYKEDKQNKGQITWELDNVLNEGTIPDDFKRQMFYTFGDYRDLCLDTDISSKGNKGSGVGKVEKNIDDVFQKNGQTKAEERKHWWDEIKKDVWDGMLCGLSHASGNISNVETIKKHNTFDTMKFSGDNRGPTLEEFAQRPQFLRWMIEWSEHFCKKQSQEYNDLKEKCNTCGSSNGIVTTEDCKKKCMQCKQKCEAYKSFIENWKKQWTQQSGKYSDLYEKALKKSNDYTEEEKHVVKYLKTLLPKSGGADTTYNSAGKYVNQKGYVSDCQQQTDFNSNTNNNNYAFQTYPHNYKTKCTCEDPPKPVYDIVNDVLSKTRNDQGGIDGCNPKNGEYPSWDCDKNQSHEKNRGACIPPRRQKFCVSLLAKEGIFIKDEEDIRETFIKSAALETYFAWKRYKEDNEQAEAELKNGKIPENFKRQMYYTFADYRDIFFGTDITSHNYILDVSKNAKNKLKEKNDKKKSDKDLLDDWWDKHGKDIWEAMLCALSYNAKEREFKVDVRNKLTQKYDYNNVTFTEDPNGPLLSKFSETPQFFRWLTEWGEDFCKQRKSQLATLQKDCPEETCQNGNNKKKCTKACGEYKTWLEKWQGHYEKQKIKYKDYKDSYTNDPDTKQSLQAYEYLDKKLKDIKCTNDSSCNCMKLKSHTQKDMPEALDDAPNEYKQSCSCQVAPIPPPLPPLAPLPPQPARPPGDDGHDQRGRSEDGENRAARPRPPTAPEGRSEPTDENIQPPAGESLARSADPSPRRAPPGGPRQPPKPPATEGVGRILRPLDRSKEISEDSEDDSDADSSDDEDDDDDDDAEEVEEEEDNNEEEEEEEEDHGEVHEVDGQEETEEELLPEEEGESTVSQEEASPSQDGVKPACDIVNTLFTTGDAKTNFKDVCEQKYGKTAPSNWKCVPTTSGDKAATSGGSETTGGSICVPPRRRKLYVTPLTTWADKQAGGTTQVKGQVEAQSSSSENPKNGDQTTLNAASSTSSQNATQLLRQAFIESAAVETFFLWDRYKKENTKKTQGVGSQLQKPPGVTADPDDPEYQLKQGKIPDGFLRQMFYTLGDYRDILEGKNDIVIGNTCSGASDKEMADRERKIKEAIKKFFQNGDSQPPSGKPGPQNSDKRQTLWDEIAPSIWNGMVCALTYDTDSGGKDKPPEVDVKVKGQLWDEEGKKPKSNPHDYTYENVKLEENSDTVSAAKSSNAQPLTLKNFVLRPPYFRYLEEWGETFCRERAKRLAQIKKDCYKNGERCSGDGEECKIEDISKEGLFADLKCPSCATPCRSYKKWIDIKKKEFDKQKSAYEQQQKKCKEESKGAARNNEGNGVCGIPEKGCESAAAFLQRLGSCKTNEHGKGKKIFDDDSETFKHTKHCDPCSKFKIKCENCNSSGGNTQGKCNGKTPIDAKDIENKGNYIGNIDMRVSDSNTTGFDGLQACKTSGIFKGFRKEQWKCRNVCGYVVCKPENGNGRENQNKIITIRGLVAHWVQNFLEDYNKIKHKISHCINNGNGSICTSDCGKKCDCVKKWVEEKEKEWKKINHTYLKKYNSEDDGSNDLTNFLQQAPFYNEVLKAIKPCKDLNKFQDSKECAVAANSEKVKDGNKSYVIDCLLDKLQRKTTACQSKHSVENQAQCEGCAPQPDEEEDLLLDETENQVKPPEICPNVDTTEEEQTDGNCDEKEETLPGSEAENGEPEPESEPEEELPPPPESPQDKALPKPAAPSSTPSIPRPQPTPIPQPSDNTSDILATTIPFGIAIALTSIVFLFLK
ncbi:hypothetical protein PFTANZ_00698, partial [Plasmodium falciparum Tanzania (2000708)]